VLSRHRRDEVGRFEEIYEEYRPAVQAYVRRRAPEQRVEDVVADTYLVCLRRLDRVPPEPLPWLYAVARKMLANERRRRARQPPTDALAPTEPAPVGDGACGRVCPAP
jgi:RNA polymerase sigma-70 factor (ECF subfamily)